MRKTFSAACLLLAVGCGITSAGSSTQALDETDPPPAGEVTAVIPVSPTPRDVIGGFGSIWVSNGPAGTISRIDPETNSVIATIPVGRTVSWLEVGAGSVWASSRPTNSVVRVDPASNSVIAIMPSGGQWPAGMRMQDGYLWVANHRGNPTGKVAKIDPETHAVVAVIPLGAAELLGGPQTMAATPGAIWVAVPNLSSVVKIDTATATVVATVPVHAACGGLAASDTSVFIGGGDGDGCAPGITQIDVATAEVVDRVGAGGWTAGLAGGLGAIWSTTTRTSFLVRMDPDTGATVGQLRLGGQPASVATGAGAVWVTDLEAGTVVRVQPE